MRPPSQCFSTLIGAALLLALLAIPAFAAAPRPHASSACSTAGLSFTYQRGSVQSGDEVKGLIAKGVTCPVARSVATKVAVALLHDRKVPAKLSGLTVHVVDPCTGCTPVFTITAKAKHKSVAFQVFAGA